MEKDPYLYQDSDVLINKFDIKSYEELKPKESKYTKLRMDTLDHCISGKFNYNRLLETHKYIFQDVYEWAGIERSIPIIKREEILGGDTVRYSYPDSIASDADTAIREMLSSNLNELSTKEMAKAIGRHTAELWQSHPFRDGNTRTIIAFVRQFLKSQGIELNIGLFSENADYVRNALVKACDGQYSENRYIEKIFEDAISIDSKEINNNERTEKTVTDEILEQLKQNAGYYILDETENLALGFSPTAPSSFAIWSRNDDGEYLSGEYKEKLSLYAIADLHFEGIDTDKALQLLTDINFDFAQPLEDFERMSPGSPPLHESIARRLISDSESLLSESARAKSIETAEYMRNYSFPYDTKNIDVNQTNSEKSELQPHHKQSTQKPVVYVCSPLAGEIEANIRKAREYSKFVAKEGNTPIAPHITELFNDTIPEERELGLSLGIDYLRKADELWVFGDRISNGVANEIRIAQEELHIPIYSVSENMNEKHVFDYNKFLQNEGGNITMATAKNSAPLSSEQIELAKKTNLFEYVQARYQIKPHGSGTYCIVEGEHDSVILFPETNTWFDFVNEKGGNPVDFLMHHEHKAFIPAVKELLGELTDPRKVFYPESSRQKERQPMVLPPHDENNNRVYAYLIKTRGIERDVVKQCIDEGTVYQSKEVINKGDKTYTFSNCIFVGKDIEGKPRYASQRSMNDNSPYTLKADVRNSDKHFGFCIGGSETAEWVTVCEAPIDVMSYASINRLNDNRNTDEYILSLGGVGTASLEQFLEAHPNVKTINIALDNDKAGRTAGEAIKATYIEKGYNVLESYPKSKDYNQDLQILREKANAPKVEIPAPSADSKITFSQLTQTKLIDKEIVSELLTKGDMYQIEKEVDAATGEKKISVGTIFVRKNEFGDPLYAMGVSHTAANMTEFKIEYINEEQTGCFLFHKGQNDTLFVFNNPVSMLSYQTIQKAMGQPIGHCVCSMTNQDQAVAEFMNDNKDVSIKRIDVMMDKSYARDNKTQQPYDYRATAFDKINNRFNKSPAKIKVTKHYPAESTLNQDLVKAVTKTQANSREKVKENDIEMEQ